MNTFVLFRMQDNKRQLLKLNSKCTYTNFIMGIEAQVTEHSKKLSKLKLLKMSLPTQSYSSKNLSSLSRRDNSGSSGIHCSSGGVNRRTNRRISNRSSSKNIKSNRGCRNSSRSKSMMSNRDCSNRVRKSNWIVNSQGLSSQSSLNISSYSLISQGGIHSQSQR